MLAESSQREDINTMPNRNKKPSLSRDDQRDIDQSLTEARSPYSNNQESKSSMCVCIFQILVLLAFFAMIIGCSFYMHEIITQQLKQKDEEIASKLEKAISNFQTGISLYQNQFNQMIERQAQQGDFYNATIYRLAEKYDEIQKKMQAIQKIDMSLNQIEKRSNTSWVQVQQANQRIQNIYTEMISYHKLKPAGSLEIPANPLQQEAKLEDSSTISKKVWLFIDYSQNEHTFLNDLYFENIKYFTEKSGFQLNIVTFNNYFYFLSPKRLDVITFLVSDLKKDMLGTNKTNLKDHFNNIVKVIILMQILEEHGGVIIKDFMAILEPLTWIEKVANFPFVNKGIGNTLPKVIAFFDTQYSTAKAVEQKIASEDEKLMYRFPCLQNFFMIAVKESELIKEINIQMQKILKNPWHAKQEIERERYQLGWMRGNDPYYEFFFLASQFVIHHRQKVLSSLPFLNQKDHPLKLALDYYGLYTINRYYGPYKLKIRFEELDENLLFNYLSKITMEELQQKIGKLQFVSYILPTAILATKLQTMKKKKSSDILVGSFLQKIFFPEMKEKSYFYEDKLSGQFKGWISNQKWDKLPKILWIYRSKKADSTNKLVQYHCIRQMRQFASQNAFSVNEIYENQAHLFLEKGVVEGIQEVWEVSKYKQFYHLKELLLILGILSKFGGVYIDSSNLQMENLNWLMSISSTEHQKIYNRIGIQPNIFLFFNPNYMQNFEWTVNENLKTRINPGLIYDTSFIAAEAQSRIIDDWMETLSKLLKLNSTQIEKQLKECGVSNPISSDKHQDMIGVDSIRCVAIRGKMREQKINTTNSGQYNVWSMDGDTSLHKFNLNSNYENVHKRQNIFLTHYSKEYSQSIIGNFSKVVKLDSFNRMYLNDNIKNLPLFNKTLNSRSIIKAIVA